MSNYTKSTNFATKDNLTPGDPLKIVRGTEIDTEYNNIATAIATKTDNSSAAITGGTINATTIGATTASTGAFSTLSATGAITSTLTTGTAPLVIASTTKVANLNVDSLDGADWASPAALGSTTPAAVSATTLTTSSTVTFNGGTANGVAYLNGSKVVTSGSALVFDGSNLGLGVTPSAWATYTALQINNGSVSNYSPTQDMRISSNAYYNSGWKYIASAPACQYLLDGSTGSHQWFKAASGTAGNAITFTQAMTLDASGRLLVGTTNALSNSLTTFGNNTGATGKAWGISTLSNAGGIAPPTDTGLSFGWNYSDAGGENNIVYGVSAGSSPALTFSTYNGTTVTERCRLDASGNLLVGTTSTTPNPGILLGPSGFISTGNNAGTTGFVFQYYVRSGTTIGSITQDGTTAVLYNTTSDQRLKENIQDAESASSLIDSLQVRQFDWKSDNSHQRYGFVAQELVTVAPEAVHQPADTEQMMAVDYSKLVPMLVKEIQSLRKRLADAGI